MKDYKFWVSNLNNDIGTYVFSLEDLNNVIEGLKNSGVDYADIGIVVESLETTNYE